MRFANRAVDRGHGVTAQMHPGIDIVQAAKPQPLIQADSQTHRKTTFIHCPSVEFCACNKLFPEEYAMSDFYQSFRQNMDGVGLPAPQVLFGTFQAAVGNIATLLGQIDKLGKAATIGDIIGEGTRLEGLSGIAACSAVYYAGAVIGSLAVASGASSGTALADVLFTAKKNKLDRKWLPATLQRWPGVYDQKLKASRNNLRARVFA
jgi:hypothetical protein